MHDPKVIAHELRRPWPERSTLPAAGDGVRWRLRHHHEHFADSEQPGICGGCDQPVTSRSKWFPWWKPSSYSSFWRLAGRDYYWPPVVTIWHQEPHGHDALTECSRRYQDKHGKWHYTRSWKWHVHHWRITVPPLQHLRRTLLTRCAWCGGKSRKGDIVNYSLSWDGPRGHWWQGEPGLFHRGCTDLSLAASTCTCDEARIPAHGYGTCTACGHFRPYGITAERIERARKLQAYPKGTRP
jgi:hypothetical protein